MTTFVRAVAPALVLIGGCHGVAQRSPDAPAATAREPSDMHTLAKRLTDSGYERLFLSDDKELAALSQPATLDRLEQLVRDDSQASEARFLAGEILARKRAEHFPPAATAASLARAYAGALKAVVEANPWGMPGQLDEPAGQHLVALGRDAVPALVPLLDDAREVIYGGSKEAMVGNSYHWRVKDFAAFFLARIVGRAFAASPDAATRDKAIAELRAAL
jgi:hypothetical protein